MPRIKTLRRPEIDYPSGRGAGGPTAAGAHTVDRKLGATPINFRLQGYSGQPSTSADSGYSRNTIQRVNKGYESDKELEDIPEVNWLKSNADSLVSMGLTPRVVAETYRALLQYRPQNERERRMLSELHSQVRSTRRRIDSVFKRKLDESVGVSSALTGKVSMLSLLNEEYDIENPPSIVSSRDEKVISAASVDHDETSSILACNSRSMEILHVVLGLVGIPDPTGIADGINCITNIICKNYFHAFIDLIALIPVAGDLAKIAYAKKFARAAGFGEELAAIKAAKGIKAQRDASEAALTRMLKDDAAGPGVSKSIQKLHDVFGTAERMAATLTEKLRGFVRRLITFFEGLQSNSSMTAKGVSWVLSKTSIDVVRILREVEAEGIDGLREFIVSLFSKKSAKVMPARAEVVSAAESELGEPSHEEGEEKMSPELATAAAYNRAQLSQIDPDGDGIPGTSYDRFEDDESELEDDPELAYMFEAKKAKTAKKTPKVVKFKDLSISKALSSDDDELDEFTTVASSGVGTMQTSGGTTQFGLPLGMTTPGRHKSAVDVSAGYKIFKNK